MGNENNKIENDNLFKALVYLPIAILFAALAGNSVMNDGSAFFQVLYVLLAIYFILGTLGYFAHFTNEFFEEESHQ